MGQNIAARGKHFLSSEWDKVRGDRREQSGGGRARSRTQPHQPCDSTVPLVVLPHWVLVFLLDQCKFLFLRFLADLFDFLLQAKTEELRSSSTGGQCAILFRSTIVRLPHFSKRKPSEGCFHLQLARHNRNRNMFVSSHQCTRLESHESSAQDLWHILTRGLSSLCIWRSCVQGLFCLPLEIGKVFEKSSVAWRISLLYHLSNFLRFCMT